MNTSDQPINIQNLIENIVRARPEASCEEVVRLAPQLRSLHPNDVAARLERAKYRLARR